MDKNTAIVDKVKAANDLIVSLSQENDDLKTTQNESLIKVPSLRANIILVSQS